MGSTVFQSPSELKAAVGKNLGTSDWLQIDQDRIDKFADATGDHQWIHVDPKRAADGPFGKTIAHGYLTQSLVNHFLPQIVEVHGISMGVNYGADKVRFPAPVPVGSRVRGGLHGDHPSLEDLEHGSPRHTTDLRSIQAILIEALFGVPHAEVLGSSFPRLDLLRTVP